MTAADPKQEKTPRTDFDVFADNVRSDLAKGRLTINEAAQKYYERARNAERRLREAQRELAASRSAALEEAAKTVEMNAVNLNALGWPKELMPLHEKFYGKDAVAATYAAAIRALKGNAAPQVPSAPYSPPITGEHPDKPAESAPRYVVPKDDLPLRCKSVDGALDMQVGVKVLAFAAERCPDLWNGEDDLPGCRITDPIKFAKEVERELNRESEDGSTRLSRMLDEAIAEAINQGAEGVEEILLSERNGE